jgi:hypothetical protein
LSGKLVVAEFGKRKMGGPYHPSMINTDGILCCYAVFVWCVDACVDVCSLQFAQIAQIRSLQAAVPWYLRLKFTRHADRLRIVFSGAQLVRVPEILDYGERCLFLPPFLS